MKISAGILMFRLNPYLEVFLVHPGGPFFTNKDNGSWSIPKGEINIDEDFKTAAIREFKEETGIDENLEENLIYLGEITQKSGKKVFAWAFRYNFTSVLKSNMVEHPKFGTFPEVDKGAYFSVKEAKLKINSAQFAFIERLKSKLVYD